MYTCYLSSSLLWDRSSRRRLPMDPLYLCSCKTTSTMMDWLPCRRNLFRKTSPSDSEGAAVKLYSRIPSPMTAYPEMFVL